MKYNLMNYCKSDENWYWHICPHSPQPLAKINFSSPVSNVTRAYLLSKGRCVSAERGNLSPYRNKDVNLPFVSIETQRLTLEIMVSVTLIHSRMAVCSPI